MIIMFVAATSLLAQPRDFKSLSIKNPPLRFAILGDRTGGHVEGVYEEMVAEVEEMKPDFVMTVGDHIEGYTEDTLTLNKQWDEYFSIVKPLSMPLYITPGNHDITTDAAEPVYKKRVGKPNYSFDINKYHFVVLDVSRWEKSIELPHDELKWLIDDLSKNKSAELTLVFFHKPLWYNTISLDKPDTLHTLFVKYGVDAVFNGHFHRYFSAEHDGIIYTAVGSSGGEAETMPHDLDYHITWVTLNGDKIDVVPIKKGAIRKWDLMTDDELHTVDMVAEQSVSFPEPLPLPEDMIIKSAKVKMQLNNISKFGSEDTLRWTTNGNWSVVPQFMAVDFMPGQSQILEFEFSCDGKPYPLPTAEINLPYGESKSTPVTTTLRATRNAYAIKTAKAPVIDGNISEDCWSNPFTRLFSENEANPVEPTSIYFAYDSDNLYFAARCQESKMDSIRAKVTARDGGVYGEDCVGIFLQPDLKNDTAYQIYFNPIGTIFDQKLNPSGGIYDGDKGWNGTYESKVTRDDSHWYVEAKIPMSQFNIKPVPNISIGVNPIRKQKRLNNAAGWQLPRDYNPRTYGRLILEGSNRE
jgi:predicted phosphodiesterase